MAQLKSASSIASCFVKLLLTGSFLLFPLTHANAQQGPQLGLTGNMLMVSDADADFGPVDVSVSTDGVIDPIVDIPSSGPLSMPAFSFGLDRAGEFAYTLGTGSPTVSSSSYRFRAGMVIDEPGSMRRLELDIPIVNMDIGSNGTLTGTIPPQDFNVWGRNADGQTVAAASLPINTGISFNHNTFQFDADVFIERIESGGGLLAGVRNVINTIEARGATFDYSLVLKQVKDPANSEEPDIAFGSDPGASFVAFPTVADDATEAEGFAGFEQLTDTAGNPTTESPFNALYAGGYRLNGQITFAEPPPQLSLTDNMVTVSDADADFERTASVEPSGVVEPFTELPSTEVFSFPTLSFGLDTSGAFAYNLGISTPTVSSSYRFRAGMVIYDPADLDSGRRLELDIPGVTMTIDNDGTLSGEIGPQNFNVWGRTSDTEVAVPVPINTPITFSENTFEFDAATLIELIQSDGGELGGALSNIRTEGQTFKYLLVLKQERDSANPDEPDVALGSKPDGEFTPFLTVEAGAGAADGFVGNLGNPPRPLNELYADGYRLTGQISFAAASTGPVDPGPTDPGPTDPGPTDPGPTDPGPTDPGPTDPGPTDPGPTDPGPTDPGPTDPGPTDPGPTDPGGGAVPPPPLPDNAVTANNQLMNAIADIDVSQIPDDGVIDPDVVASINNVLDDADTLADIVTADLVNEDISAGQAIDTLATLNDALEPVGTAIQAGADIELATVTDVIDGIGDVIDALDDPTLSPALMEAVQAAAQSTLAAVPELVADDADPDSTEAILDSASTLVNAVVGQDATLEEDFKAAAQALAESVLRKSLDDMAAELGRDRAAFTFTDGESTRALLAENTTLLDRVLEVAAISLTGGTQLDAAATQSAIEEAGVSTAGAEALTADLNQFVIPPAFMIEIDGQSVNVLDLLNNAPLGSGAATVDSTTGAVEFASDLGTIKAFVTGVAIVPDSVPEGFFINPDGSAVSIADCVAISLAPSPADPIEFVRGIESVGRGEYTTAIRDNGILALTHTPSGDAFNATFAFEVIGSSEPVAMTDFEPPEGNDPADPEYKFEVTFEDGSTQFLLPMMAAPQFYDSVTALGFEMETDRSTGVISIDGLRFRADYISWPATSFEIMFLNDNADEFGVAYIPTDANGDGITDFKVITRIDGVAVGQIVCQLP